MAMPNNYIDRKMHTQIRFAMEVMSIRGMRNTAEQIYCKPTLGVLKALPLLKSIESLVRCVVHYTNGK